MKLTLEEGIRILLTYKMESDFASTDEFLEALKLGIQALTRIRKARDISQTVLAGLLPSEVKDE